MAAWKKYSYPPAPRNWYRPGPDATWQYQLQKTPDASGINISYDADTCVVNDFDLPSSEDGFPRKEANTQRFLLPLFASWRLCVSY